MRRREVIVESPFFLSLLLSFVFCFLSAQTTRLLHPSSSNTQHSKTCQITCTLRTVSSQGGFCSSCKMNSTASEFFLHQSTWRDAVAGTRIRIPSVNMYVFPCSLVLLNQSEPHHHLHHSSSGVLAEDVSISLALDSHSEQMRPMGSVDALC